mmetsp:Transcript_20670/g.61692  ORF Transcript_20670/g.61692 Transcript_20670/m.61692 type:complete len:275 (-) Transcript_20670:1905-2729(-)
MLMSPNTSAPCVHCGCCAQRWACPRPRHTPLLLLLPPRCAPDALPGFGGPSPSCAAPAGGAARAGVASCMPSRAPLSSGPPPSAATAASALPSAAEAAPLGKTACRPSEGAAAGQAPAPKEAPDALASTPVSAPAGATAVPVASGSTMRPLRERSSAPPTCWLTSTSHACTPAAFTCIAAARAAAAVATPSTLCCCSASISAPTAPAALASSQWCTDSATGEPVEPRPPTRLPPLSLPPPPPPPPPPLLPLPLLPRPKLPAATSPPPAEPSLAT